MDGKRLLHELSFRGLLSFGPDGERIALEPLNVLIGPNASGKSNVLEAISLLHAAPTDIHEPMRRGGGAAEWLWKGSDIPGEAGLSAVVSFTVGSFEGRGGACIGYHLAMAESGPGLKIVGETVEVHGDFLPDADLMRYEFDPVNLRGRLHVRWVPGDPKPKPADGVQELLPGINLDPTQSILSQRRDPDRFVEITHLALSLAEIRSYSDWNLAAHGPLRSHQATDLPGDFLLEDGSNLALVLNDLEHRGMKPLLVEKLQRFYEPVVDISAKLTGGRAELFLRERDLVRPIPATRLSDGTLRYLCLLAILLHPDPPPLVCIEEPELGLHPDIIPTIGELLKDASQRMQLIVTTHSDMLVSALSDVPEAVIVCERDKAGTHLRRLDPERLRKWLDDYSLGDLWLTGELGGVRW